MTIKCEAKKKRDARIRKHVRVRKKVAGTQERPRLSVYKSNKHIYAQVINDALGTVICAVSTNGKVYKDKKLEISSSNIESAKEIGKLIGQAAIEKGVKQVSFDKGGFLYHGRIKAIADGAREAGLVF